MGVCVCMCQKKIFILNTLPRSKKQQIRTWPKVGMDETTDGAYEPGGGLWVPTP